VNINSGRGIPSEAVCADVISQRIKMEKMSAAEIIIIQRTKNDPAVAAAGAKEHSGAKNGREGKNVRTLIRTCGAKRSQDSRTCVLSHLPK
jgi:hypothetical protein